MLYAILCYDAEDVIGAWTKSEETAAVQRLDEVQERLTVRKEPLVTDGPFVNSARCSIVR